jgi:preprotein translocase subunit YajC
MQTLIIVVLLFALAWFFFVLPSRRRQRSHKAMQDSVGPGDEIITAGGLHGTVREIGDDEVHVEIASDVVVRLDRRAIAAVAQEVPVDEDEDDAHAEEDDDAADADGEADGGDEAGPGAGAEQDEAEESLKG